MLGGTWTAVLRGHHSESSRRRGAAVSGGALLALGPCVLWVSPTFATRCSFLRPSHLAGGGEYPRADHVHRVSTVRTPAHQLWSRQEEPSAPASGPAHGGPAAWENPQPALLLYHETLPWVCGVSPALGHLCVLRTHVSPSGIGGGAPPRSPFSQLWEGRRSGLWARGLGGHTPGFPGSVARAGPESLRNSSDQSRVCSLSH